MITACCLYILICVPEAIAFHIALTTNPEVGLSNAFMDEEAEVNL